MIAGVYNAGFWWRPTLVRIMRDRSVRVIDGRIYDTEGGGIGMVP
jgi:hypothetical protein